MFKLNLLMKKPEPKGVVVTARLNARLQPIHRGEHFEDPLGDALKTAGLGEVTGGGTQLLGQVGAIEGVAFCDLEIVIPASDDPTLAAVIKALEEFGAPKGSKLIVESDGREIAFGVNEGAAVYINGADLPDEVYASCTLEEIIEAFDRDLAGRGKFMSLWQGERDTALYLYGRSFEEMKAAIAPFMASYPLCERARIEQIA